MSSKPEFFAAVVILSYNDSGSLPGVVSAIAESVKTIPEFKSSGLPLAIVCIDDGSVSDKKLSLSNLCAGLKSPQAQVFLLKHFVNLGQGAALQTGFTFIKEKLHVKAVLTMDADGQHDPNDIGAFLKPILSNDCDVVFGNRFSSEKESNVPAVRRVILKCAVKFEAFLTGVRLSDSHNGFRCLSMKALRSINLKQARMAHATEIKLSVARSGLRYGEVPTSIRYSSETLAKGQSNFGALAILRDLARAYFFE